MGSQKRWEAAAASSSLFSRPFLFSSQ
jgi:hypothetical protein